MAQTLKKNKSFCKIIISHLRLQLREAERNNTFSNITVIFIFFPIKDRETHIVSDRKMEGSSFLEYSNAACSPCITTERNQISRSILFNA